MKSHYSSLSFKNLEHRISIFYHSFRKFENYKVCKTSAQYYDSILQMWWLRAKEVEREPCREPRSIPGKW